MFKIYVKNNYFFIKDANSLYEGLKKDVRVNIATDDVENPKVSFSNVKGWNDTKEIKFSQIVDENDAPFADIQAFVDFYTANTGNFNTPQAGGNFIPLTGTEVGSPVTGDIEMANGADIKDTNARIVFKEDKIQIGFTAEGSVINLRNDYISHTTDHSEKEPENKLIYAQRSYVDQKVADSRPYKVYTALLTQSGTDAPVATVLENTLGATITTSYIAVGIYRLISDIPVFTINKTYSPQDKKGFEDDNSGLVKVLRLNLIDDTTMDLRSSSSNDALANQFIEIRVYN